MCRVSGQRKCQSPRRHATRGKEYRFVTDQSEPDFLPDASKFDRRRTLRCDLRIQCSFEKNVRFVDRGTADFLVINERFPCHCPVTINFLLLEFLVKTSICRTTLVGNPWKIKPK